MAHTAWAGISILFLGLTLSIARPQNAVGDTDSCLREAIARGTATRFFTATSSAGTPLSNFRLDTGDARDITRGEHVGGTHLANRTRRVCSNESHLSSWFENHDPGSVAGDHVISPTGRTRNQFPLVPLRT